MKIVKTKLMLAFALLVLVVGGVSVAPIADAQGFGLTKVLVCHKGKLIMVGLPAAAAHLAHGDQMDTCASEPPLPS